LAAIGASTTAKRLAIGYVLFKVIAAVIALVFFPLVTPLLVRASKAFDGVTLLAAYHTAYNVVGVLVLLPLVDRFTRLVERILPERGSPLTRCLDPSALATPILAAEAVRRTIARALAAVCGSVEAALIADARGQPVSRMGTSSVHEALDALRQAQVFLSDVAGPPDTDDEQQRLTSTLHALDHASRLAETAGGIDFGTVRGGPDEARAGALCADAMRIATSLADDVALLPSIDQPDSPAASDARALSTDKALVQLEG
jgi:phosphate:Na+ symporter